MIVARSKWWDSNRNNVSKNVTNSPKIVFSGMSCLKSSLTLVNSLIQVK